MRVKSHYLVSIQEEGFNSYQANFINNIMSFGMRAAMKTVHYTEEIILSDYDDLGIVLWTFRLDLVPLGHW